MTNESVKTRVRQPEAKREAILAAALRAFSRQGYHGAQTAHIARDAGVAVGSVFRLFHSKEELANAVFVRCDELYESYLAKAPPAAAPRAQFSALFRAMAAFHADHPEAFNFYEVLPHRDFLDDAGKAARQRHKARIFGMIRVWQRAGALRPQAHEVLRAVVIGAFARLVREAEESPYEVTAALLADLEQVCWDAVRAT